jgi:hypothetical protein
MTLCQRCKATEPYDESDLCEDCLGLISLGESLLGLHGESEQREARESVYHGAFWRSDAGRECRRLMNVARYWRGEFERPHAD